jgi:hypothetical protein
MPLKSMKIFLHRQIDVSQIHQKEAKNKRIKAITPLEFRREI